MRRIEYFLSFTRPASLPWRMPPGLRADPRSAGRKEPDTGVWPFLPLPTALRTRTPYDSAGSLYEKDPIRRPKTSQDVQLSEVELTLDRQAGGPSYRISGSLCFRNAGLRPAALNAGQKTKGQGRAEPDNTHAKRAVGHSVFDCSAKAGPLL